MPGSAYYAFEECRQLIHAHKVLRRWRTATEASPVAAPARRWKLRGPRRRFGSIEKQRFRDGVNDKTGTKYRWIFINYLSRYPVNTPHSLRRMDKTDLCFGRGYASHDDFANGRDGRVDALLECWTFGG